MGKERDREENETGRHGGRNKLRKLRGHSEGR